LSKDVSYDGKDIWRDIPGYNGKYQASRLGDVRRVLKNGEYRAMTPYRKNGEKHKKILRERQFVKLTIDGKSKEVPMLKVMQLTFLGAAPKGKVPYHKNGLVTDNRAENIGFISRQQLGAKTGGRTKRTKCVFKIDRKGEVVEIYTSARTAAKENNMSYQTVLDRCHNKVKKPFELDGYNYQFEIVKGRD
jgi:hypothetical protein